MTSFLGFKYQAMPRVAPIRVRADIDGLNTERRVLRQSGHRWDVEQPLSGKGLSYAPLRAHQMKFDANVPFVVPMPQEVGANGLAVGMTDYPAGVTLAVRAAATAESTTLSVRSNTAGVTLYANRYISFLDHQDADTLMMVYMVTDTVAFANTVTDMSVQIEPPLLAPVAIPSSIELVPNYRGCWQPEAIDAGIPNTMDGYIDPLLDMYGVPT